MKVCSAQRRIYMEVVEPAINLDYVGTGMTGANGVIVDKATIQDVVVTMNAAANATPFSGHDEILKENLSQMTLDDDMDSIDVSQYLQVVDAFSMPSMQYDYHRKGFIQWVSCSSISLWWLHNQTYGEHTRSLEKPSLLSSADAKGDIYRDRFNLIRQRVLRNENFLPPSLQIIDNDNYLKVKNVLWIGH